MGGPIHRAFRLTPYLPTPLVASPDVDVILSGRALLAASAPWVGGAG